MMVMMCLLCSTVRGHGSPILRGPFGSQVCILYVKVLSVV